MTAPQPPLQRYALVDPSGAITEGTVQNLDHDTAGRILDADLIAEWGIGHGLVGLGAADAKHSPKPHPLVPDHLVAGSLLVVGARRSNRAWNGLTEAQNAKLRGTVESLGGEPPTPLAAPTAGPLPDDAPHPEAPNDPRDEIPPAWRGSIDAIVAAVNTRHQDHRTRQRLRASTAAPQSAQARRPPEPERRRRGAQQT